VTTTKTVENDRIGEQPAMRTPPIVLPPEWEAAREQLLVKEKALTRARDALAAERRGCRGCRGKGIYFRRARGQSEPAQPVRGPPSADHLPRLLRARRARLAEHACIAVPRADQVATSPI